MKVVSFKTSDEIYDQLKAMNKSFRAVLEPLLVQYLSSIQKYTSAEAVLNRVRKPELSNCCKTCQKEIIHVPYIVETNLFCCWACWDEYQRYEKTSIRGKIRRL